ncbi:MAG: pyridoxal-phosphate dependent enzyme [Candidatus Bipolaricaulota bacterium]|nr:pyridoxal-phosphate dependent enzyme [Candidatus Bipolaricaulota bacterium]
MSKHASELRFKCTVCGKRYPTNTSDWCCPSCGGPFVLVGTPPFNRDEIASQEFSLWRYHRMLGVEKTATLGEGLTPLVPIKGYNPNVLFKLEFLAPTGSFKDRGVAVMTSFLRSIGVKKVVEDSSGNAAASLAAYCGTAGIKAKICVPSYTSPAKLGQIKAYGAELVSVPGPRAEARRAAEATARKGTYYASHYWNPFALEGLKTFAYELVEQLNWSCPDNIVVPCGHGTLLLGAYYGLRDLMDNKVISRMPRIFAVQAAACDPVVKASDSQLDDTNPISPGETVAEGIQIAEPVRGREILSVFENTHGKALSVEEEEILQAHRELRHSGLYVEFTSAVAVAGLKRLLNEGIIDLEEKTVVALTGNGLKNPRI